MFVDVSDEVTISVLQNIFALSSSSCVTLVLVELIKILAEDYGEVISKPGLSHRFAKIKSLAVDHYNNKGKKSIK